ncbi:unnamed protein product [Caenorhabditis sp. 36 PRJEB53466]|nr:unnamed protein product [Caenorhabditis sp. 36 PRJEB53466]
MFLNMISFLILSLASLFSYGTLFLNALLADHDCDFLFFTQNCSFLRRMFLFSILLTTLTHASLVLERAYATCKLGEYEYMGPKLGIALGSASLLLAFAVMENITAHEDSSEMLTNCFAFSSSPSIGDRVYSMFRFQLALEIVTWAGYIFLIDYHRKKVRQQSEGHLGDRFQGLENMIVLKQLGPLILTSSAIIGVYIVTSSTGRLFRSSFTLPHYKQFLSSIFVSVMSRFMPHNSLISMSMYYFLFKWGFEEKKKRMEDTLTSPMSQRKPYMDQLMDYWNKNYKNRSHDGYIARLDV